MTSTSSAALAQPPLRSRQAAAGHRHRHRHRHRPLLVPLRPLHALLLALALALHLAAGDWAPSASFAAAAAANPSPPPPPFTRALAVPRGGGLFGRSGGGGGGGGRRGGIGGGRFGRGRGRGRRRGAAEKGGGGGATEGTGGRGTSDGGGGDPPPPPPEVPVYPALTTEEIVDVLNVPVYAITDRHGNGAVLTAPAGTDASAFLGDGGSSSDGNEGGREDGQDGMGGTRTGGKEGTDGTDVVYFFLSRRMAAMALRGLLRTNEGLDLRVTPLHLGKVWFHLMEGGREGGLTSGNSGSSAGSAIAAGPTSPSRPEVRLIPRLGSASSASSNADPPSPSPITRRVSMRLVPDGRDLVGARLLQGLDPDDLPALQEAMEEDDPTRAREMIRQASERSTDFRQPFDRVPVFMVSQLRMTRKEEEEEGGGGGGSGGAAASSSAAASAPATPSSPPPRKKFPMFLSPRTLVEVYQQFVGQDPEARTALQPTVQLGELHQIVRMMQAESTMDFRNCVLLPASADGDGSEDDGEDGGSDDDSDDDDDGGDGRIGAAAADGGGRFTEEGPDLSGTPFVSMELGVFEAYGASSSTGPELIPLR